MKFASFGTGEAEFALYEEINKKYGYEMDLYRQELADLPEGFDHYDYEFVSTIEIKKIDNSVLDRFKNLKVLALRSIGFQYVDLDYCKKRGIVVTNASYDPYNVADYAIMLMLMVLRHAKVSVVKALVNDFSLEGLRGRNLNSLTVGVLGTGKIGSTVIQELSGFGCKMICYDIYENEKVKPYAQYKSLEEVISESDILTLHMPLNASTYHIINKEMISKMKDGVILINTARGPLCDTEALIDAIESEKIGGLGLDTIEGEEGVLHEDLGVRVGGLAEKKNIMYIKQFSNVIVTPHTAFFTKEACRSMVESAFKTFDAVMNNKEIPNNLIK